MLISILIFSSSLSAATGSLLSQCYDEKSGEACLKLSSVLARANTETAATRSKLARKRACSLGERSACGPAPATSPKSLAPLKEAANDKMTLKRSEVETEISKLPSLLQDARLEARDHGFEFTQIEAKSAYERLGFRKGDILLEINGHVLEDSTQAMELFILLRSESNFKVKLKRLSKVIERRYEIRD